MNKYQKISDNIDKYDLSKKDNILFSNKTKWVVTEKIHGSNFAIYYRNGKIEFSKRNQILEPDEWFYNYHLINFNIKLLIAEEVANLVKFHITNWVIRPFKKLSQMSKD